VTDVVGLVLAAGAGARFGGAKALARTPDGEPWIARAVATLLDGGVDEVLVVLGASAEEAVALVPAEARAVIAEHWQQGMGASLSAGIAALPEADTLLVSLVDLPELPTSVIERVLGAGLERDVLARAVYAGRPGHPVLVGRDHWSAFRDSLHGDEGGRKYLEEHDATHVECGDLFTGSDVDLR
jgi:CTP:molybdopterin cytidylyltransferase MocA